MRILTIVTAMLFFSRALEAQVTNSWSADISGFYYKSIDTLVRQIKSNKKIQRIIVNTEGLFGHQKFPKAIDNTPIEVITNSIKIKEISPTDIYIKELELNVDGDEVSISCFVLQKPNKYLIPYGGGGYSIFYKLQPDRKTYILKLISEVSVNFHFFKKA